MNKIFKTTLVLVSLILGFGYAEKARYDNEDEEMEYDNNPGEIKEEFKEEIEEETHRVYRTFFEKLRYGIKVSAALPVNILIFDFDNMGFEAGIGAIASIPLSKNGPFKIESGIESNFDGDFRIPLLLDYYPLSLTTLSVTALGGDGRIVMLHFKGGVFFDWKYDHKYDEDTDIYEESSSLFFDSQGVIFTFGFKAHKDGAKILTNHLAMEFGISYKNSKFRKNSKFMVDYNLFYLF